MAVYTFTQGEKLTANLANTYMTNGGLVYISSTTIGSAVSSVTVSNCFSATYDAYKILITGGAASGTTYVNFRTGLSSGPETGSVYQYSLLYTNLANTPLGGGGTATAMNFAGSADANGIASILDVISPYQAGKTLVTGFAAAQGSFIGGSFCLVNTNTQYTHFTIYPNAGTFTGGTITVYGYRKA